MSRRISGPLLGAFRRLLPAVAATAMLALAGLPQGTALAAADAPQRGGELVVTLIAEPTMLCSCIRTAATNGQVSGKIFEGLVTLGDGMAWEPALATGWQISDDGLTYTFNLREGVTWHDGTPFTARDVKFSLEEVWSKIHPRGRTTFANVTAVETPDDHTVIIRLNQPSPVMRSAFHSQESTVVPAHIYEGTDIRENKNNMEPIGTGPFRFVRWDRGDRLVLARNEAYWDAPKPYLDGIVFRFIPDGAARAAALETGEVQVAPGNAIPFGEAKRLQDVDGIEIGKAGVQLLTTTLVLEMNHANKALADPRVRKAIAHAINRDFLAKNVWLGFATPATGLIPSYQGWYNGDVPAYGFDPKQAKALLDEAGYPEKDGGIRFKLRLEPLPWGEQYTRTADVVKQFLKQVGIDTEIRNQDVGGFVKAIFLDRDYDLGINLYSASTDPSLGVARFYRSNPPPWVPYNNPTGYSSEKMDGLIAAIAGEPDQAKRQALIDRMQQVAAEDLPFFPMLEVDWIDVYRSNVHGAGLESSPEGGYNSYADVWIEKQAH